MERQTGRLPKRIEIGAVAYAVAMIALAYLLKDVKVSTSITLFGVALAGQALGITTVHMLGQAFIKMRGEPWRKRWFPMAAAVLLAFVFLGGVFTT